MWNLFKNRRRNKQHLRELKKLSTQFAILDEFARRGLVYWKAKDKMLLIESSLASLKLAEGSNGFQHFLDQLAAWQNYHLASEAYEIRRAEVETAAVRRAQRDNPYLTRADIYRIRQLARSQMGEIRMEDLHFIKEFDLLIIRATAVSAKDATEQNGELLAVGHYDGQQVEMALYKDIQENLQSTPEE